MVLIVFLLETLHVLTLEDSVYAQDNLASAATVTHEVTQGGGERPPASSQMDDTVRIVAIYGPRSLKVGELANFRARLANDSERPVIFRWSLGDGSLAEGNNVSHRYQRSGRYRLVVTARSKKGSDTDSLTVLVEGDTFTPVEPVAVESKHDGVQERKGSPEAAADTPPQPSVTGRDAAFRGSRPISWSDGGYTLLVATTSEAGTAEQTGLELRRRGLRSGIYLDGSGIGAPVYRVVVGQFADESEAVRVRAELLASGQKGAYLVHPLPRQ